MVKLDSLNGVIISRDAVKEITIRQKAGLGAW